MSRIIALQIRMRLECPSYQQMTLHPHQSLLGEIYLSKVPHSPQQSVMAPAGGVTGGFQDESEIFQPKYLNTLTQILTDTSSGSK